MTPTLDEETEVRVKDINSEIVCLERKIRELKRDRQRVLEAQEDAE